MGRKGYADGGVVAEKHGGGDNEHDEEDAAGADGAEDGADSASSSHVAEKHHDAGETEHSVGNGEEGGHDGQTRSLLLAVDVTVINHGDEVLEHVSVQVLVVVVDLAFDRKLGVPALGALNISPVGVSDDVSDEVLSVASLEDFGAFCDGRSALLVSRQIGLIVSAVPGSPPA